MRFMKFRDNTTHDSYGVLKVCNLDDILDKIADKMDDVGQIEHGWNFINKEFSMKSSISSTIAHNSTYT